MSFVFDGVTTIQCFECSEMSEVCGGIFGLISAPDSKPTPVWNIFPCVILEVMYAPDKVWEQDYIWLFAIHVLFSVVLASFPGPSSFPRLNALLFSKACNGL